MGLQFRAFGLIFCGCTVLGFRAYSMHTAYTAHGTHRANMVHSAYVVHGAHRAYKAHREHRARRTHTHVGRIGHIGAHRAHRSQRAQSEHRHMAYMAHGNPAVLWLLLLLAQFSGLPWLDFKSCDFFRCLLAASTFSLMLFRYFRAFL